jgi:benzoate/toluate 1,2-dioxygenase alpha subunit
MGQQPVVINQDNSGRLRGFINACTHRGANICRRCKGNAETLSCPYHGRAFGNDGMALDIRGEAKDVYPPGFKKPAISSRRFPESSVTAASCAPV